MVHQRVDRAPKRITCIAFICALLLFLPVAITAQLKIPETRLRILYKDTIQPAEWVRIYIRCWKKNNKAERIAAYEKKCKEDKEIERRLGSSFLYGYVRNWKDEEFKRDIIYEYSKYHETDDGWITIPAISEIKMDYYSIEIRPALGNLQCVTDPRKYNIEVLNNNYCEDTFEAFDEKTFPRFAATPEKDRILYAGFRKEPEDSNGESYEGIRFNLAAFKIWLQVWPKVEDQYVDSIYSSCMWNKQGSWHDECPFLIEEYFLSLGRWELAIYKSINRFEGIFELPIQKRLLREYPSMNDEERLAIHTKAEELRAKLREIVCDDLAKKKQLCSYFEPPRSFLKDEDIKGLDCEALGEYYQKLAPTRPEPENS